MTSDSEEAAGLQDHFAWKRTLLESALGGKRTFAAPLMHRPRLRTTPALDADGGDEPSESHKREERHDREKCQKPPPFHLPEREDNGRQPSEMKRPKRQLRQCPDLESNR